MQRGRDGFIDHQVFNNAIGQHDLVAGFGDAVAEDKVISKIIRHGRVGLLFPPGNVAALADQLELLLVDEHLRQKLERQGVCWVCQEHSWDKTTAIYCDVYADALGKKLDVPQSTRTLKQEYVGKGD